MSTSLAKISKARQALEQAKTMDDVLDIRDKAEALRVYVKAVGEGLHAQNAAAEIKLRAERKAGEMLEGIEAGRPPANGNSVLPLSEMGIGKMQSSRWQREATVDDERFEEHVQQCNEEGKELTQASVLALAGAGHVSQSTAENEWYTPPDYIEAARATMGAIDLDPASSDEAQKTVQAGDYFTVADDGLYQDWEGRVWLNPPYSKELIGGFVRKLVESYEGKVVTQAIALVNNATETAWFQELASSAAAICFPSGRIQFLDKTGKRANSPLQGQAILYFGRRVKKFAQEFGEFGFVASVGV